MSVVNNSLQLLRKLQHKIQMFSVLYQALGWMVQVAISGKGQRFCHPQSVLVWGLPVLLFSAHYCLFSGGKATVEWY